jgi:hypothetical protein
MSTRKAPVEVVSAAVDIIVKVVISLLVCILVVALIWIFLDGENLVGGFIGAMIPQIVLRAFDKEFRKNVKVVWFWFKEKPDFFPDWVYGSKKEKMDMEFMNIMDGRNIKPESDTTKVVPTSDDLKTAANKSLLDD